jgi:hypothetical protein
MRRDGMLPFSLSGFGDGACCSAAPEGKHRMDIIDAIQGALVAFDEHLSGLSVLEQVAAVWLAIAVVSGWWLFPYLAAGSRRTMVRPPGRKATE